MDLGTFAKMIDMVGGIDVVNPSVIDDGTYDWLDNSPPGFYLAAGPQHLDGRHALAYVRSRHGSDNSDWKRARDSSRSWSPCCTRWLSPPDTGPAEPHLDARIEPGHHLPGRPCGRLRGDRLNVPSGNISQVVLGPPYSITGITTVNAASCLLNSKVAALSIQLFGKDSLWSGKPAPANTCPS